MSFVTPSGHRGARVLLVLALIAACTVSIAAVILTGLDDTLLRAGTELVQRVRAAWSS